MIYIDLVDLFEHSTPIKCEVAELCGEEPEDTWHLTPAEGFSVTLPSCSNSMKKLDLFVSDFMHMAVCSLYHDRFPKIRLKNSSISP